MICEKCKGKMNWSIEGATKDGDALCVGGI